MIKNKKQIINNGVHKKSRKDVCAIIENVMKEIDPYRLVLNNFQINQGKLRVGPDLKMDLNKYKNIYVAGAGKAAYKMACAVESVLKNRIVAGCVNAPELPARCILKKIELCQASHPVPNASGVKGTKKIKKILGKANVDDLVIGLISGGGSSLMPLPVKGVSLAEKIKLTSQLIKTSASINEINSVRKHLSRIKGGQFACLAYPATLATLYISDVVGDPLDVIASGPCCPDPTTYQDAIKVLQKYNLWDKAPKSIKKHLMKGLRGKIKETPKSDNKAFRKARNIIIANHSTSVKIATAAAKKLEYNVVSLGGEIQGNAHETAKRFIKLGQSVKNFPTIIIGAGETTIEVRGNGKGGRNQELVLSGLKYLNPNMTLVSFATDGIDGASPAAGAMGDRDIENVDYYLKNNDSYSFFKKSGDCILTGPTGTNIGDLIMLVILSTG